jgi:hypothetical protein
VTSSAPPARTPPRRSEETSDDHHREPHRHPPAVPDDRRGDRPRPHPGRRRRAGAAQHRVRLRRPGRAAQARRAGVHPRQPGRAPAAAAAAGPGHRRRPGRPGLGHRRHRRVRRRDRRCRRRPGAHHRRRVRGDRADPGRRRGLGRRDGQARAGRRRRPRRPAVGRLLLPRGARAPRRPGARLPPGRPRRPALGAPGGRRRRLRRHHPRDHHRGARPLRPAGARRARLAGGHPARPQADRDHPARGPLVHPRGRRRPLGRLGVPDRLRRPRGPDHQPALHRRPVGRAPRLDRRDGRALRRPLTGPVLAELLRHRRVPLRPVHQLPRAGLRLPGRHPVPGRDHRRRDRCPAGHAQRHLHARGGLRRRLEAHRHVHRHGRDPAVAAAGGQLLHHDRQLRLRLLLVPLHRRHHPAGVQGDRCGVHLGLPRRGAPLRHRDRPGPGCTVPPAPVLRPAGHGRGRRRRLGQHRARGGRRPGADERHQPLRQRVHPLADPDHPGVRERPVHRRHEGPDLARRQPRQDQPPGPAGRLRAAPGERPGPAGRRRELHPPAGHLRHQVAVGDGVRPGRALSRGRLRQPAPGGGRSAGVHLRRRPAGGHRRRPLAHLRADPLPAARGLAGHAHRLRRLRAQAGRVLRRQPRAGHPGVDVLALRGQGG